MAALHAVDVDVDGTARLLDAAVGRPVVWVSSAGVYAPGPGRSRTTEDHPVRGHLNAYGRTKAAGEAPAPPRAPSCCGPVRSTARGTRTWCPGCCPASAGAG